MEIIQKHPKLFKRVQKFCKQHDYDFYDEISSGEASIYFF